MAHKGQVAGGVLHLPRGVAPAEGWGGGVRCDEGEIVYLHVQR